MFRKDLLMRQFESFGKALALLMGMRKNLDWDQFEKELEASTLKFAGKQLSVIEAMSDEELQNWLKDDADGKIKIVAGLLFEKMMLLEAMGLETEYKKTGERCSKLYKTLQENLVSSEYDLDVHYKMQELANRQFN